MTPRGERMSYAFTRGTASKRRMLLRLKAGAVALAQGRSLCNEEATDCEHVA